MTIGTVWTTNPDFQECYGFSQCHLTKTTRDFAKLCGYAQSP